MYKNNAVWVAVCIRNGPPGYLKSKQRGATSVGWRLLVPGTRHRLVACERGAKVKMCLVLAIVSYLVVRDNHISIDDLMAYWATHGAIMYTFWLPSVAYTLN